MSTPSPALEKNRIIRQPFQTFFCALFLFVCLYTALPLVVRAAPAKAGTGADHAEIELLRKDISEIREMLNQFRQVQEQMAKEIQGIKIRIRRSGGGNA